MREEQALEIIDERWCWKIYWPVTEAGRALTHFQVAPLQVWSYKAIKAFRLPQMIYGSCHQFNTGKKTNLHPVCFFVFAFELLLNDQYCVMH